MLVIVAVVAMVVVLLAGWCPCPCPSGRATFEVLLLWMLQLGLFGCSKQMLVRV